MEQTAIIILLASVLSSAFADTPANCSYEDIKGKWVFSIGQGGNDNSLKCDGFSGPIQTQLTVDLQYPDLAVDEYGNIGFWTLIYNQGFEVVVAGRKFFAFSAYKNATSYCGQTLPGWTHDSLGHDWACYVGRKPGFVVTEKKFMQPSSTNLEAGLFFNDKNFVESINSAQKLWKAAAYPQFEGVSKTQMIRLAGGPASVVAQKPRPAQVKREVLAAVSKLPKNFDWRNVDGVNYVSPVRNQGSCGSCYSFASMAMNEARVRILTNNTQQPVFSPQDIVDCCEYAQGCDGGFPYLIGGKYAEDFGLVLESDNPYKGQDQAQCGTPASAKRHYSTSYQYVGGYYGACNEPEMRLALYENGPLAVGFEVLDDFFQYKSGIYHHSGLTRGFFPFELTNHAVLVVGYGVDDPTGTPFWIVKNSWGTEWGEEGFFRIMRGNDECAFESMAMQATPILAL